METLESLQRQLRAAEDLQSVVRTMKSLAAVNIRQYEQAARSLAGYSRTIELGFTVLVQRRPEWLAGAREETAGRTAAVAVGSDQGMCGQFNQEMTRYLREHLSGTDSDGRLPLLLVVGGRLAAELEAFGSAPDAVFPLASSLSAITDRVRDLLFRLLDWQQDEGVGRILVFHHRPLSGASYRPHRVQLVPVDLAWLGSLRREAWPTRVLPTFMEDWGRLFSSLVRQHLFTSLYRALAESAAAENAARLAAMQAAENNIQEKLDDLTGRYNRRRQSTITEELLDVIAGFEMMGGV